MAKISHVSKKATRTLTASAQTFLRETRVVSAWEDRAVAEVS